VHPRARELIRRLELQPHPEGGLFRRTYASRLMVQPRDARESRVALTAIYFLLADRGISRWHRVLSDEAWHWYEGAPLELFTASADGGAVASCTLGPCSDNAFPQHVVPAGDWQAARTTGEYTLVGCCVAPGFDFADFALLASLPEGLRPRLTPDKLFAEFL
jgi:predicted cupin superfamily sugar epimerase